MAKMQLEVCRCLSDRELATIRAGLMCALVTLFGARHTDDISVEIDGVPLLTVAEIEKLLTELRHASEVETWQWIK